MKINQTVLPILSGILVALIFGFSFLFTANALALTGPLQLLGYRFGLAALSLTLVIMVFGLKLNFKRKKMGLLLLIGFFQPVTYFVCETLGVQLTSSSEAGMMIGIIPVVVTALAAIFLKERPSWAQWFFIIISVSGVVFIVLMGSTASHGSHLSGLLALAGAVLAAAIFNILSRKSSSFYGPIEITFFMMWTGALVFNSLALVQNYSNGTVGNYFAPLAKTPVLTGVLYLGVISSVLAFFLINYMLSKLPASQSAVFNNLTTVVSVMAGVFLRNEPFGWYHVVGVIAILAGVWGTNYFKDRTQPPQAESTAADDFNPI